MCGRFPQGAAEGGREREAVGMTCPVELHIKTLKPRRQVIGGYATIVDSAETTAEAVAGALTARVIGNREGGGGTRFLATDSPERFARVGAIFLGRPIDASAVELVDLRSSL